MKRCKWLSRENLLKTSPRGLRLNGCCFAPETIVVDKWQRCAGVISVIYIISVGSGQSIATT